MREFKTFIDKDVLLEQINGKISNLMVMKGMYSGNPDMIKQSNIAIQLLQDLIEAITNFPSEGMITIGVGEWVPGDGSEYDYDTIRNKDSLYCSHCGSEAFFDSEEGYQRFDYCPNCGSKMNLRGY